MCIGNHEYKFIDYSNQGEIRLHNPMNSPQPLSASPTLYTHLFIVNIFRSIGGSERAKYE